MRGPLWWTSGGEETPVLGDAGKGPLGPVPVADLVAEHRADAQLLQRGGDRVERPVDRVRRGVVVHQRGRARQQRLHAADQRRQSDGLLVERPVQPPPDPLQDLGEVERRVQRGRHAAGELGVQVGVGAHVPGEQQAPGAVAAAHPGRRHPDRGDAAVGDHHVGGDQLGRVQGLHDRGAAERERPAVLGCHGGHRPRAAVAASLGTAARAAGESFIGSRVRRTPS